MEQPPPALFDWDDANRRHLARHAVPPEEAEQCNRNDSSSSKSNLLMENSATSPWAKPAPAAAWPAFFAPRGARVRFVTAYPVTPQQQESYEEG